MMALDKDIINETKAKIKNLIRQGREAEARYLLVFLRDQNVEPDGDIRQFQNRVGMPPPERPLTEVHAEERKQNRRQFILDRLTSLAVAAFLYITTGAYALAAGYLLIDWTLNVGRTLTTPRILLTASGALVIYLVVAFALAVTA